MPAADALFDGPRPLRVILQHLRTMVGLDHQHVGLADALPDVLRGMAEIGEPGEAVAGRKEVLPALGEEKRDGIVGVVRHGEALDLEVAETEAGSGFKVLPVGAVVQPALHCAGGGVVGKNLDLRMARKAADPDGMVTVLVGEKDGIDAVERFTDGGEQPAQAAGRKPGVNQHAGVSGLEQGAIAFAAAAEDAEPHAHLGMMQWPAPTAKQGVSAGGRGRAGSGPAGPRGSRAICPLTSPLIQYRCNCAPQSSVLEARRAWCRRVAFRSLHPFG